MFCFLETEALCAALSQKGQKYAGYHQEYNRENTLPNLEETCGASATIRAQGTLCLILATLLPEEQDGTENNLGKAGYWGRQNSFFVRINIKKSTSYSLGN